MIIGPDLWLMLGIVAFYLYDALVLLHANETVYMCSWREWESRTVHSDWQLLGKNLFIPNPLAPARVLFPVTWTGSPSVGVKDDVHTIARFLVDIRSIQVVVSLLALTLFIALPAVLFRFGHGSMLLTILVLIYLMVIFAAACMYMYRDALGISAKDARSIALDSIACPPFALNMVHKICAKRGINGDALDVAKVLMSTDEFLRLLADLSEKVDASLVTEEEDDDSRRYQRLVAVQKRLKKLGEG